MKIKKGIQIKNLEPKQFFSLFSLLVFILICLWLRHPLLASGGNVPLTRIQIRPFIMVEFKPDILLSEKERILLPFGQICKEDSKNCGDWLLVLLNYDMPNATQELNKKLEVCHAMGGSNFSPLLKYGEIFICLKTNINTKDKQRLIHLIGKDVGFDDWPKKYLLLKITNGMNLDEAIDKLKNDSAVEKVGLPPNCELDEVAVSFKKNISSMDKKRIFTKVGTIKDITYGPDLYIVKVKKEIYVWDAIKILKSDPSVENANLASKVFCEYGDHGCF